MHTSLSMLCRTAGQLGILTAAATTLASSTVLLPDLGELAALVPPTLLVVYLLELLLVPGALVVFWACGHPRRQRVALVGCGVLACLLICRLALLQSWNGLYSWWGASYLFSTVVFPLGGLGLIAVSYRDQEPGINEDRVLGRRSRWIFGILVPLVGLRTLAVWSGRLPSMLVIGVMAACMLYGLQRWVDPATFVAPWVPVAAMLTALAALQHGLYLAVVALGPIPTIPIYESVTTGLSALTGLTLTVVWGAREHRARNRATRPPSRLRRP
jgi:hypothetical protein